MKKVFALSLVFAIMLPLLTGCFFYEDDSDLTVEVVQVLYVERGGFIARTSRGITYVKYRNATAYTEVGDAIEIHYRPEDMIAAIPDKEVGGYIWTSMLLEVQKTQKQLLGDK